LWALKSGRVAAGAEETAAMIRGRLLEPVALDLLREQRPGWEITQPSAYYRSMPPGSAARRMRWRLIPNARGSGSFR
jgi:hypothetical protein